MALLLLGLLLPACHEDDDDDSAAGPLLNGVVASGTIGPDGGTVEVTDPASPFFGSKIEVPPGAVSVPTAMTIKPVTGDLPDGIHELEFGPLETPFAAPAQVTVTVSSSYLQDFLLTSLAGVRVVGRFSAGTEILEVTESDLLLRTVTASTPRTGRFAALLFPSAGGAAAAHYRLIAQDRMLAAEAFVQTIEGEDYAVSPLSPGARSVAVGKGSLDAVWTSGRNLILLHSTADDALQFVGAEDLIVGLSGEYDNIVTYQFHSGRKISENANWLYNEVQARAGPGFSAQVLGYSMGGLVAVSSAVGVPALADPEAARVFPPSGNPGFTFSHSKLHSEAVSNGVRDAIVLWLRSTPT